MVLRALFDVLFPRTCASCGAVGWPFCPACVAGVVELSPPWCLRCGRPRTGQSSTCLDCPPPAVAWSRTPFLYSGPVRRALMRLKFGGHRGAAEAFAPFMADVLQRGPPPSTGAPGEAAAIVITWVPLGRRRKRARGFDQAHALARALGERLGTPPRRTLERRVETAPQARRAGDERRLALAGAFRAVGPVPARLLLVDDVLTSGSTAAECARTLLASGAREVGLVTAARSLGGPLPDRCYNPAGLRPGSVVARETFSR